MRHFVRTLCVVAGVAAASAAAAQSSANGRQSREAGRGVVEADRHSYREGNENHQGNGHVSHGKGAGYGHDGGRRDAPEPLATIGLAAGAAIVGLAAWRRARRGPR
jgi:hypothetical protein